MSNKVNIVRLTRTYKTEIGFTRNDFDTDAEWDAFVESCKNDPKATQKLFNDHMEGCVFDDVSPANAGPIVLTFE